jgi:hypothetical protein
MQISDKLYWIARWYFYKLSLIIKDFYKAIYKVFIWKAKPKESYINPHLVAGVSIMAVIIYGKRLELWKNILLLLFALFNYIYADIVKGEWIGYMRKMTGELKSKQSS